MKEITQYVAQGKLDKLIEQHELWLNTDRMNGKRLCLEHCDLSNLDFSNHNLTEAYFFECDLESANFSGSDLTDVEFLFCDNFENIITNENTLPKICCPEKGEFIGYKKCRIFDEYNYDYYKYCIVKLLIPDSAKRSSGTGNKCRCSKAYVLGFYDFDGNEIELDDDKEVVSWFDDNFEYKVGEWIFPDGFNESRWKECTNGIHFYVTFEEAVND